ncbi:thioesterase family protein [Zhihengliuella sp.]|uniref:thioesterase family protein n=1 Tax=Zhihengliuella sp. TaxID=1954483 RepID=UPI002810CA36|nr:thioesterase family protein [Zhihengliuella sp.]
MHMIFRLLLLMVTWRRRSPVGVFDVARLDMRAMPTDIDTAGHINNGMYFSLFDLGRFDLMLRAGVWNGMVKRRWVPVVQAETVHFRKSVTLGQKFTMETRIAGLDERHIFLEQRIVSDGEIYASGMIAARFRNRGGAVPMPEVLAVFGTEPPADLRVPDWVEAWLEATRLPSTRQAAPSDW